ncbi:uncharacterized protein VTP21DRAFT_10500 [Calcarisporiella thermophila]|uniref:uncharacterized protein n=1 Tax=Calcarisporiella thermophila TaxID=911321 RepID=UPI003743A78D
MLLAGESNAGDGNGEGDKWRENDGPDNANGSGGRARRNDGGNEWTGREGCRGSNFGAFARRTVLNSKTMGDAAIRLVSGYETGVLPAEYEQLKNRKAQLDPSRAVAISALSPRDAERVGRNLAGNVGSAGGRDGHRGRGRPEEESLERWGPPEKALAACLSVGTGHSVNPSHSPGHSVSQSRVGEACFPLLGRRLWQPSPQRQTPGGDGRGRSLPPNLPSPSNRQAILASRKDNLKTKWESRLSFYTEQRCHLRKEKWIKLRLAYVGSLSCRHGCCVFLASFRPGRPDAPPQPWTTLLGGSATAHLGS